MRPAAVYLSMTNVLFEVSPKGSSTLMKGRGRCTQAFAHNCGKSRAEQVRASAETVTRRTATLLLAFLPALATPAASFADGKNDAQEETVVPIYFGNGCFWGRQKEFVDVEKAMGRQPMEVTATVGYAGGKQSGPAGLTCYYYGPRETVYEKLGHAEVVQLELRGPPENAREQMQVFADAYFRQFRRTPFGMIRLDPQDAGPGYRNVIGLPGGTKSPLFQVLQERNVNGMRLVQGSGNEFLDGKPVEDDKINTVYILDSNDLPFHRAELYHQFHDGIGKPFPLEYKRDQKRAAIESGRVGPTGCPELNLF
eukprot:jgi/Botrbrau1/9047/Bobra.0376s0023.1